MDGQVVELLADAVLVGHGVAQLVIYREERATRVILTKQ